MNKFIESGSQFGGEADATAEAKDKGVAAAQEGGVAKGGNLFEIDQMTDTAWHSRPQLPAPGIGKTRTLTSDPRKLIRARGSAGARL